MYKSFIQNKFHFSLALIGIIFLTETIPAQDTTEVFYILK